MYPTGNVGFSIDPEAYPKLRDTDGLQTDLFVHHLQPNGNTYNVTP